MKSILSLTAILLCTNPSFANCDVTKFRWECDVDIKDKPTKKSASLVRCGRTNVYVTPQQFLTIMRYQRASINMVLKVNGEFIDSPCTAANFNPTSLLGS